MKQRLEATHFYCLIKYGEGYELGRTNIVELKHLQGHIDWINEHNDWKPIAIWNIKYK